MWQPLRLTIKAADLSQRLFTSSDKAVNPTSVMGVSKLLSERLVTAGAGSGDDFRVHAVWQRRGRERRVHAPPVSAPP